MQIYLAPMEGLTTFIYRNAFNRFYGGIDKYFTPFLANKNLSHKDINDVMPEHNKGMTVVPQILTNHADVFLSIASKLTDYGYPEVNLNLGCPSGTVVARKRGAGFLSVPDSLDAFLSEIFDKCPLDISIKTRIGIESLDEWVNLLAIFAKYPLKELIIHPRLQKEFYKKPLHPEAFHTAQNTLSIPLCYNGDITSFESLAALMAQIAPVPAIMIGRGALSNPQLPMLLRNGSTTPNIAGRAFHDEILAGYTELMSGSQPVLFRMKELWSYMRCYVNLSDKQMKKIQKAKSLEEYKAIIRNINFSQ